MGGTKHARMMAILAALASKPEQLEKWLAHGERLLEKKRR